MDKTVGEDSGSGNQKTILAITTILVALIGLLSSPVWGPATCRAIGLCDRAEGTGAAPAVPPTTAALSPTTPAPQTPQSPVRRSRNTGYPVAAGAYCDELVRAWQDGYTDRVLELSNQQVVKLVSTATAPTHYRNDWGPTGQGAICSIVDTDRGDALVVRLVVKGKTGQPGAITEATI